MTAPISRLVLLAAALAACGEPPAPATCSTAAECPTGSWCRSGGCVADAPPVASIEPPPALGTNRPLTFRGGGSHDADPGDSVVGFDWRVAQVAAAPGCDPSPLTGTERDITVVFPCPGDHDVTLAVKDTMGVASPPATLRVRVEPTIDPPQIATGPDRAVDHRCAGEPLRCTTWDGSSDTVSLSAAGVAPEGMGFRFRWSVERPAELAGQPAPTVTFLPDETSPSPAVRIETAGTAIAGRYVFVATAVDARGMVAVARQSVEVGNRPPVLVGGGRLLLPHAYEPSTRSFLATGETPPATWVDPDGDPVTSLGFTSTHAGDGGATFDVLGLGDHARLTVVVPLAGPGSGAFLVGPGVTRRVELAVADANGARASVAWDVEVTNRAPRLVTAVPETSVDHTFEAAFQRYAAQAPLSTWVDDDGDPLVLAVEGDPLCAEVVERSGTAWVTCSAPYAGSPDAGRITGWRTLRVRASDPFTAGPAQETRLEIRNRPPRLVSAALDLPVTCVTDPAVCCTPGIQKGTCAERDVRYLTTTAAPALLVDDDGDPLEVDATAGGGCLSAGTLPHPCTGAACSPVLTLCGGRSGCAGWMPQGSLALAGTDGLARVEGSVPVTGVCPR